ncbi:MAG TPA: DMT family transporter [Syntrophomonadaceae bacterium]|nr:DMT family transporter [Syntrophomonadaceae bacterium]
MPNLLYLGIAAISGAAMAIQGTLNSVLGKIVGIWESILIVHIIGTITVIAVMAIMGMSFAGFSKLEQVPWYVYLGGVLNVVIVYTVVSSMPKIGVGNATTAILVTQILTAILIDSIGILGLKKYEFHYYDLLGIVLLAAGARILLLD